MRYHYQNPKAVQIRDDKNETKKYGTTDPLIPSTMPL